MTKKALCLLGLLISSSIAAMIPVPEVLLNKAIAGYCKTKLNRKYVYQANLIRAVVICNAVKILLQMGDTDNTLNSSLNGAKAYASSRAVSAVYAVCSNINLKNIKGFDSDDEDFRDRVSTMMRVLSDVADAADAAADLENAATAAATALCCAMDTIKIMTADSDSSPSVNVIISIPDELQNAWKKVVNKNDLSWKGKKNSLRGGLFIAIIDCSIVAMLLKRQELFPVMIAFAADSLTDEFCYSTYFYETFCDEIKASVHSQYRLMQSAVWFAMGGVNPETVNLMADDAHNDGCNLYLEYEEAHDGAIFDATDDNPVGIGLNNITRKVLETAISIINKIIEINFADS